MLKKSSLLILIAALSQSASAQEINFFEQVSGGGVAILVILGLSILALAVAFERFKNFRIKAIAPEGLIEQVIPLWKAGEFEKITLLLESENSTLARIIAFMVSHRHQSISTISSGCGDLASIELRHQQHKAYALAIVATVAPIVGLLGTVIGMIEAFHVIAFSGAMGDPALLAGGISKALINTASGLSVALPALALHHFFKNRLTFFGLALEKKVNTLISECLMLGDAPHAPTLQMVSHAH